MKVEVLVVELTQTDTAAAAVVANMIEIKLLDVFVEVTM